MSHSLIVTYEPAFPILIRAKALPKEPPDTALYPFIRNVRIDP